MLYYLEPESYKAATLKDILENHPEIKFVSLIAVDLGNNHTDERIPIEMMKDDIDGFLRKGVQTDGSSVNLPKIADINNAKVDIIPDLSVKWFVDYNPNHFDEETGKPVGTLMIPSFLEHDSKFVGSRAILKNAMNSFEEEIIGVFRKHPEHCAALGFESADDIAKVELTTATELEFWVKTPDHRSDIEKLSTSQTLKEQYWKRTVGPVRTALEQSLEALTKLGMTPEMGHKEVGGVPSKLKGTNKWAGIMEQIEIDWEYDEALQSIDNELFAKNIIKDTYERNGLVLKYDAKPIEGVAGSGEHHHVGAALILKSGKRINLFASPDMKADYLSVAGWGALMGLLKNYEVINPFVTSTNDAFNRLKPGFEAPVCTVASVGHSVEIPTRNRTVLVGLVRDMDSPLATRFELRSPNPNTNSYLATAACYITMLDGIKAALASGLSASDLEKEFSKPYGVDKFYLEKDRAYRSEEDVFEDFTEDERNKFFAKPPATVWENLLNFENFKDKVNVLTATGVFNETVLASYKETLSMQWTTELKNRIIPSNMNLVRRFCKLHGIEDITDLDVVNWEKINAIRYHLMKDSMTDKSLFSRIREGIEAGNFDTVSDLQLEMAAEMNILMKLYIEYKQNLLFIED